MAGIYLSDLIEGSAITLKISNKVKTIEMHASLLRALREDLAIIELDFQSNQRLNFDNVHIEMESQTEDGTPYKWNNVKIGFFEKQYILRTEGAGTRFNRREYFRVGVSKRALMRMVGRGQKEVILRDVSMTGFAITDQRKELDLLPGDELSVHFEDLGHVLDLVGRVVRVQEEEDVVVYGLRIINLCKDLSSYISMKQRGGRASK
ncbi:MAG: PilZ domain-containing protein [Lachnospiraceae bacterium]|nr:PilZ domain-containing protein [Lachnospiraceae bacterium]